MHSLLQNTRQLFRTVCGILIIAFAVSILCICLGQAMAAEQIHTALDDSFTTIAIPSGSYLIGSNGNYTNQSPGDILDTVAKLIEENAAYIENPTVMGLTSAYIPELDPDNLTQHPFYFSATVSQLNPTSEGTPYNCAVLEIQLEEIREPEEQPDGSVMVKLRGPILSAVSLQEGYRDPTGMYANVFLYLPDLGALEELKLCIGRRYLVFSTYYFDADWNIRSNLSNASETGIITIEQLDPEKLYYLSEEEIQKNREKSPFDYDVAYYSDGTIYLTYSTLSIDNFNAVWMVAVDQSQMPLYCGTDGNEVYSVPTVVELDGSVEDFLSSNDGLVWQSLLDQVEINNHAFPIIGVTNLYAVPNFNRRIAKLTQGREFTSEESALGANVCIISEYLANANGLTIGDTITLHYYENDDSLPYQSSFSEGYGIQNPTAAMYFAKTTPFVGSELQYTIVGLYSLNDPWGGYLDNLYAFTLNTVFVPMASVESDLQYSQELQFGTIELKNGYMDEFSQKVFDSDYPYLFEYYDQGYSFVKENLQNYDKIAGRAMIVGLVVYGVLLVLYLMLFPTRMGDSIHRMGSMGAQWWRKMCHILLTGLGILLPGTILGTAAAVVLWDRVVHTLTAVVVADLELQLDPGVIISISAVQLLLALVLTGIVTLPMTLGKLMNRR